ncbi:2-dehydropantoate 2-reductase [Heyndrickxia coagulans]|jgi:2-dehydropantoate 2-reductase|uniref:2-dehydropantoate 2-reductase n=2 Tax=Heyndrickxia coagulans TaxID=1398 RepID=A0A133KC71_HEYCO|nr:2-dehydropantoate 2-reductase [Heyndrickxia coagulans]
MEQRKWKGAGKMKIGIIGAGAIGLLYGGWLGKLHEVTLFPRTKAQAGQLNEKGITVKDSASSFRTIVKADGTFSSLSSQDLVIVAVKQYDLPAVAAVLKHEDGGVPALFLQNGMGHLALLEKLPQKTILVGTVEHGASRLDGTTVKHNGHGKTNIAVYRGKWDESVQLHTDAFPFTMQPDYELMLLRKCFANAVINPLTAILKAKNGELVSNPHYARVFRAVFEELAALFPKLSREKMWEEATGICKNTCENESSMLKDVKKGARTEIDAILGYMLETAARQNSRVPLASALYEMVKGMEEKG